ncbi:MAG: hypothetical protein OXC29_24095, partial [Rhodococcus sp.]|nr:hypothetical protein [Rhodococcus sp. (in: high G+C Gram-positive bacteria)]
MTTAILVMACPTGAHAQSPSRAEVQLGVGFLDVLPGLVVGGTGWITERTGLAARVYFLPGYDFDFGNPPGLETTFRQRRFVGDVEIDIGMGLMTLRAEESNGS